VQAEPRVRLPDAAPFPVVNVPAVNASPSTADAGPARASSSVDPVARAYWHPLCALESLQRERALCTRLMGERVQVSLRRERCSVRAPDRDGIALPVVIRFGYVWTRPDGVDDPSSGLFELPEYDEPDRRNVHAATVGVRTSAPRAVENFLDMGHFPFVHTGVLGAEPHTEVREYEVALNEAGTEVLATQCRFHQPQAAAGASGGMLVDYVYRVPHPYCSVLYKSCPSDESRLDVIALFLQPVEQESVRAHALVSVIDTDSSDLAIRMFQQSIFAQDKPILENQRPVRLPLDPRAETPIRADRSAIVYRRWLSSLGLSYGCLPAPA